MYFFAGQKLCSLMIKTVLATVRVYASLLNNYYKKLEFSSYIVYKLKNIF